MATVFATSEKTKDYINMSLANQGAEERIKPFMADADLWAEEELQDVAVKPIDATTYPQLVPIVSMYAAGLFVGANSQAKEPNRRPWQLATAERRMANFKATVNQITTPTPYSKDYRTEPMSARND